MSLACGNCRGSMCGDFGILYRLERTEDGKLRYPNKAEDYVPANSSVCESCWRVLPASEKHTGQNAMEEAEKSGNIVFAYASGDSGRDPFGRATWSGGINTEDKPENLVFISPESVAHYLPGALEIIEEMQSAMEHYAKSHPK